MENTLKNMTLQRDLWRERALHDRELVGRVTEAAQQQHRHCESMECAALEAVLFAEHYARMLDAVMNGDTGIGGAL